MKTLSGPLLALAALLPQPAWAGQAADAVGYFYAEGIGMEADESSRNRFTGPARAYLDASDRAFDEREEICLDFGLAVDGQDFDAAEVAQTLELEEAADGGAAIVVARFTNFGEPRDRMDAGRGERRLESRRHRQRNGGLAGEPVPV